MDLDGWHIIGKALGIWIAVCLLFSVVYALIVPRIIASRPRIVSDDIDDAEALREPEYDDEDRYLMSSRKNAQRLRSALGRSMTQSPPTPPRRDDKEDAA